MKRAEPEQASSSAGNTKTSSRSCFLPLVGGFFCPPAVMNIPTNTHESLDQHLGITNLSPEEQDRVYRDLYGLEAPIEENDTFRQEKLHEFQEELDRLELEESHKDYLQAFLQESTAVATGTSSNPLFVSQQYRLMFLRSERFDIKKAALRFCRHWDLKLALFGPDKMGRKITQSDMNSDDMVSLRSGAIRVLPGTDRAGRPILWFRRQDCCFRERCNMIRTFWYIIMSLLAESEDAQTKGVVVIAYQLGQYPLSMLDREFIKQAGRLAKAVPLRVVGYHQCYNDLKLRMITSITLVFLDKATRARFRNHVGNHGECIFDIMTFGIAPEVLPVSMEGEMNIEPHLQWLEEAARLEESQMETG